MSFVEMSLMTFRRSVSVFCPLAFTTMSTSDALIPASRFFSSSTVLMAPSKPLNDNRSLAAARRARSNCWSGV